MKPLLALPLGRPTFDVPYAEEMAARAFAALDAAGIVTTGPRDLLFDAAAARSAIAGIDAASLAGILLLQVTFTDASMTVEIARAFPGLKLGIWAFPEPRAGGRLRLNSFCGLNLAAHALGRANIGHASCYAAPEAADLAEFLRSMVADETMLQSRHRAARPQNAAAQAAAAMLQQKLMGLKIGLIGEHPTGFDTCRYEPEMLRKIAGITVEPISLTETFARARAVDAGRTAARLSAARNNYARLETVDQGQLEKSLALHEALDDLRAEKSLDALAVRCWPETFTEYGCAVCGPMGMLTEAGTACACEADVLGAFTAALLQTASGAPAWLVDIVDMEEASDSSVFWHCGSAPLSMRDATMPAAAQIHSNRRMPLLAEFTLKPGRITVARLTQARNSTALVLGAGDVIRAPMSFTGTSAVVRLDGGAAKARAVLIGEALEHHVAMVYGDQRATLEAWAAARGLPVIDLTPAA